MRLCELCEKPLKTQKHEERNAKKHLRCEVKKRKAGRRGPPPKELRPTETLAPTPVKVPDWLTAPNALASDARRMMGTWVNWHKGW